MVAMPCSPYPGRASSLSVMVDDDGRMKVAVAAELSEVMTKARLPWGETVEAFWLHQEAVFQLDRSCDGPQWTEYTRNTHCGGAIVNQARHAPHAV